MSREADESDPMSEPAKRPASGILRMFQGQMPWALLDQMLISATNFITLIFLGRAFTQSEMGTFWLVYTVLLFVNSVQSGFFTQPHNILGATRQGDDYRSYTSTTGLGQLAFSAAAGVLALLAWGIAAGAGWDFAPLLLALAPAIVAWQAQEYTRRVLYTEGHVIRALVVDIVGYGGQVAVIIALRYLHELSGPRVLYALAAASALGALLGVGFIRHSLTWKLDREALLENWHFGKWIVAGEILGPWLSAQLPMYIAAATLGPFAAGIMRAVHTAFGPARVLSEMLYNILPIRFSRTFVASGRKALHRQVMLTHLAAGPLLGGYCLLVAIFAGPVLRVLYKDVYDGCGSVLALYSVAAFASYMAVIIASGLRARRRTRDLFTGQLIASAVSLPAGWLLIYALGVHGMVLGILATYLAMGLYFWIAYSRRDESSAADEAADEDAKEPTPLAAQAAAGAVLERVFRLLDAAEVPYCVTHGYEDYPAKVASDVDLVMPREAISTLPALLHDNRELLGACLIQWVHEDTHYLVLAGIDADGAPFHLRLDISEEYELRDRVLIGCEAILAGRQRHGSFWIPQPQVEFACRLLRYLIKRRLDAGRMRRLSELYAQAPEACREQVALFFSEADSIAIVEAAASGEWALVVESAEALRSALLRHTMRRRPMEFLRRRLAHHGRRLARWLRPRHGLHVVFLGPDGAGKSSVVAAVREGMRDAFFSTTARSFPPALLNHDPDGGAINTAPHDVPPRSWLSSSFRAATYWLGYHTVGYLPTIHAELARFNLVIHDRHLLDCLVDPRRYRYTGPRWLLKLICRIIPRPDLLVVMDAPAQVIHQRKREVPIEETERQLEAYRQLAQRLPMARQVDASQSLPQVIAQVNAILIETLARRIEQRLGLAGRRAGVPALLGRLQAIDPSGPWRVGLLGEGNQAEIFRAVPAGPAGEGANGRILKVFKTETPDIAVAVGDEFECLSSLHPLLHGVSIEGWRIEVPRPLFRSDNPPAVVMAQVAGRSLNALLSECDEATAASVARTVAVALWQFWAMSGRIYGDLDLNNILCDPQTRTVSLVDPGMPEAAYLCPSAPRRCFPASRDLAYLIFDAAALVRMAMVQPRLFRRQVRFAANVLRGVLANIPRVEDRQALLEEIIVCSRIHLSRIPTPWTIDGLGHRLIRASAGWIMDRMFRSMAETAAPPADQPPAERRPCEAAATQ